ncbi:hypothetical protein PRZ48_001516 [Zasmidium cellare]|uniref:Uncharacterized protein n=1 Tax=Zasmidium cellare TaxID=395010 RepID=A0ABR0F1G5_ZASCE|nr:hypothetical protein PRZ48_001516 [Zasmidium cellare]
MHRAKWIFPALSMLRLAMAQEDCPATVTITDLASGSGAPIPSSTAEPVITSSSSISRQVITVTQLNTVIMTSNGVKIEKTQAVTNVLLVDSWHTATASSGLIDHRQATSCPPAVTVTLISQQTGSTYKQLKYTNGDSILDTVRFFDELRDGFRGSYDIDDSAKYDYEHIRKLDWSASDNDFVKHQFPFKFGLIVACEPVDIGEPNVGDQLAEHQLEFELTQLVFTSHRDVFFEFDFKRWTQQPKRVEQHGIQVFLPRVCLVDNCPAWSRF